MTVYNFGIVLRMVSTVFILVCLVICIWIGQNYRRERSPSRRSRQDRSPSRRRSRSPRRRSRYSNYSVLMSSSIRGWPHLRKVSILVWSIRIFKIWGRSEQCIPVWRFCEIGLSVRSCGNSETNCAFTKLFSQISYVWYDFINWTN